MVDCPKRFYVLQFDVLNGWMLQDKVWCLKGLLWRGNNVCVLPKLSLLYLAFMKYKTKNTEHQRKKPVEHRKYN